MRPIPSRSPQTWQSQGANINPAGSLLARQSRSTEDMLQPIVGYHQDEEAHWVAELGCGHFQHVRHNPPWTNRPWVVTEAGRHTRLGQLLECKKCDAGAPRDH